MKKRIWEIKSRYALVTCYNNGQGIVVEKIIAPLVVNNQNVSWVNETSVYFRKKLHEVGILLAEPYECFERDGKAIQVSPYVGLDLEKIFQKGEATTVILHKLISSIKGVLSQHEPEVGIDARLSNFCLGPDESLYYVDTFPPLVKYEGEYIVHFPNPTDLKVLSQEFYRKFHPLGILRRLRFSILEQDLNFTEEDILKAVFDVMGKEFGAITKDYFQTFLDHMELSEAVEKLTLKDPDGIRELALKFMPEKGKRRTEYLETIFDLSSNFCPIKISEEERISRICNLLSNK